MNAEELAELLHTTYEALAPGVGYKTRTESAVPWEDVPSPNKELMIAVAATVLKALGVPLAVGHFRPGLYRHYKGGYYTAFGLVFHHEGRHLLVRYVSHTHGGENVRPLEGVAGDPDGWIDLVEVDGKKVPRFRYVGQPDDRPLSERW